MQAGKYTTFTSQHHEAQMNIQPHCHTFFFFFSQAAICSTSCSFKTMLQTQLKYTAVKQTCPEAHNTLKGYCKLLKVDKFLWFQPHITFSPSVNIPHQTGSHLTCSTYRTTQKMEFSLVVTLQYLAYEQYSVNPLQMWSSVISQILNTAKKFSAVYK